MSALHRLVVVKSKSCIVCQYKCVINTSEYCTKWSKLNNFFKIIAGGKKLIIGNLGVRLFE